MGVEIDIETEQARLRPDKVKWSVFGQIIQKQRVLQ
jgi:hypothetical protein